MIPFLTWLLKANLILVLLYGFYVLFLRGNTFHAINRWYLLGVVFISVILPVIVPSGLWTINEAAIPDYGRIYTLLAISAEENTVNEKSLAGMIPVLVSGILCSGILFFLFKRVRQLISLFSLVRTSGYYNNSLMIRTVSSPTQPFSFFGWIFLYPSQHHPNDLQQIITHERIHCRNWHTFDILAAEVMACFCWFNPVAWLLRNDIRQNIEYYTDRKVLQNGFDRKHYQYNLLQVSTNNYSLVNHFHFNHLKNRIVMINKKDSSRIQAFKYALLAPVLLASVFIAQASELEIPEPEDMPEPTGNTMVPVSDSINNQVATYVVTSTYVNTKGPSKKSVTRSVNAPVDTTGAKVSSTMIVVRDSVGDNNNIVIIGEKSTDGVVSSYEVRQGSESTQELIIPKFPADSQPLLIIDGKVVESIGQLLPDKIQSISVFKDKTAVEKYGEKGRNGVILIETKKQ